MKTTKRGFTIVELVIVIAVIAILAAVLIPTFSGLIRNAQLAADQALVKNLNTALASDENGSSHPTMDKALQATAARGLDVAKIKTTFSGNKILWDSRNDCFVYLDNSKGTINYIPESEKTPVDQNSEKYVYFQIVDTAEEAKNATDYSVYFNNGDYSGSVDVKVGFDAGSNNKLTAVNYSANGGNAQDVIIRTVSYATKVTVNAASDTVRHYGPSYLVDITAVADKSYHEHGDVGRIQIASGHVVAESGAHVMALEVKNGATAEKVTTATIETQETTIAECADGEHVQPIEVFDGDYGYSVCSKCGYTVKTVETAEGTKYETAMGNNGEPMPSEVVKNVAKTDLNEKVTLEELKGKNVTIELGTANAEEIAYSENNSGYTGKGVKLGSTNLNKYAAKPANVGEYKFIFRKGTVNSAATGYASIDGFKDTSVYILVPGNSDVIFDSVTFNGVFSFDVQMYTSPWSYLNSITFKNCTFNGIIVGSCPALSATFEGCAFNNYTNTEYANNSNPIWWRAGVGYWGEGADESIHSLEEFTFVNNTVKSTRPVKIERIGWNCTAKITIKNNSFDISKQAGDTETKNMGINIGQRDNTSKFILTDDGNTISANTASLYTAALGSGSNQYIAVSGSQVLDGNGNAKTITAMVWKTTTGETFEMKSID